jgi:hypothetical protein
MIKQTEFDFFGGKRDVKRNYVYEYEKDSNGIVIRKENFFVPHTTEQSITKTDNQGNQKTTFYGFTAKEKKMMEIIFYNSKGERIKKIEYDRENKPQFIWTYDYEYYN